MASDDPRDWPADTEVRFRSAPDFGVRYRSGLTVFDESLDGGRLVGRYWSAVGAIKPEAHLAEQKARFDLLPVESFHLRIDDHILDRDWQLVDAREQSDARPGQRHAVVELAQASLPISARVHTRFDGSPFLVRWLEVKNGGDRPVSLSAVSPFSGLLWCVR